MLQMWLCSTCFKSFDWPSRLFTMSFDCLGLKLERLRFLSEEFWKDGLSKTTLSAASSAGSTNPHWSYLPKRRLKKKTSEHQAWVSELDADMHMRIYSDDEEDVDDIVLEDSEGEGSEQEAYEHVPRQPSQRRSDLRASYYGLSGPVFRRLFAHAPIVLLNILFWLYVCPCTPDEQSLDMVEMFSGVKSVTNAVNACGFKSEPYDLIESAQQMDFTTDVGFLTAVQMMRQVRLGGAVHWATQCSNWVWLSRSQTKRSHANPMGDLSRESVRKANLMVSRMAALLIFCHCAGIWWVLEQPASSFMALHHRMQEVKEFTGSSWCHIWTWMGAFGANTAKGTRLWSNRRHITRLIRKLPKGWNATHKLATKDDAGGVSGIKQAVHDSEAYPKGYGEAVACVFSEVQHLELKQEVEDDDSSGDERECYNVWDDLFLQQLADRMNIPHDRPIL